MSRATAKRRGLPVAVKMRHDQHFVEGLTVRHGAPIGKLIPISAIEPDPDQPRSAMGDLSGLASSIRDKGILEPILVRPIENSEDKSFRIISGERRYQAALKVGLYEVPVIEMEVSDTEALEIALIENLQRKDLTPFEEADGYRALAESYGYTHQEIAGAVGRSRTVVTESLSLLQIPAQARAAAEALGVRTKSTLLEVLKEEDEVSMIRLLEQVAEHGLSRDDLRAAQRKRRRPAGSASRRKPYSFKFNAPDKSYNLSVTFRKSMVDKTDLIAALREILAKLSEEGE